MFDKNVQQKCSRKIFEKMFDKKCSTQLLDKNVCQNDKVKQKCSIKSPTKLLDKNDRQLFKIFSICAAFEEIERVALKPPQSTKEMIELVSIL